MAKYIERLNDGTVREVKYNPKHDGSVTESIYLEKRMRWLGKEMKTQQHMGYREAKKLLKEVKYKRRILRAQVPRNVL